MFSPGEKHWHGAAPEHAMVHLAFQEADSKGEAVTWFEHVTDTEYNAE
jgi:quercetin dioxygenase-like cupin family protein